MLTAADLDLTSEDLEIIGSLDAQYANAYSRGDLADADVMTWATEESVSDSERRPWMRVHNDTCAYNMTV